MSYWKTLHTTHTPSDILWNIIIILKSILYERSIFRLYRVPPLLYCSIFFLEHSRMHKIIHLYFLSIILNLMNRKRGKRALLFWDSISKKNGSFTFSLIFIFNFDFLERMGIISYPFMLFKLFPTTSTRLRQFVPGHPAYHLPWDQRKKSVLQHVSRRPQKWKLWNHRHTWRNGGDNR